MIIGKSKKEIEKMRAAGQLVGHVLHELRRMVEPGIPTIEIDRAAEKMIRDAGALPTFKGYHGFPYSICASINEQVVHGFPSNYKLKEGDIFSIDCGVTLEGFVGDTATTVPVGTVREDWLRLVRITEECLERAIEQCRPGKHLGDIGWAVQEYAEAHDYSVVRDYVGHGIGRAMDEEPQVGMRPEGGGIGPVNREVGGGPYRVVLLEKDVEVLRVLRPQRRVAEAHGRRILRVIHRAHGPRDVLRNDFNR